MLKHNFFSMKLNLNRGETHKKDVMYRPLNSSIFGFRKYMQCPCYPLDRDSDTIISYQVFLCHLHT